MPTDDFVPDDFVPDDFTPDDFSGDLNSEEQRAQRVRSASPQELRKIHFGENVPAGERAAQQSGQVLPEAAEGATGALMNLIAGAPQAAYHFATNVAGKPVEEAKFLRDVVTAPFKDVGKLHSGTPREVGGAAVNLGALAYPTAKLGGAAAEIGLKAGKAGAGVASRRIVNSIIKPSLKEQAFTKDPTGAVLKHRIIGNSLEDFSGNVEATVEKLNGAVEKNVAKSSGQVSPAEVNGILENTIARVGSEIGNTNSTGIIGKLRQIQEQVMSRYGDRNLSVQEVHALRREIDNGINFTEDAVEQGVNKGKYEFRTGLNDIIERHVPGVKATNMDISSLLSAKEALAKRLNSAQNAPILPGPLGIGVEAAAAGGALATGHGLPYAAARLGLKAAGTTAVKSRAAQALESMSGMREPITPIKLPPIEGEVVAPGGYPDQVGLPPATSIQMPSEMNPPRPVSGQLPGRSQLQLPGGSQFDLAQPTYDVVPPTGGNYPQSNVLSPLRGTPSNPNQLAVGDIRGGYRFKDAGQQSLLNQEILEQQRAASVQGGIQLSERRWGGQPQQVNLGEGLPIPPELESISAADLIRQLPPEINNSLGMFLDQLGLNAKGNYGTTRSFVDTAERTGRR